MLSKNMIPISTNENKKLQNLQSNISSQATKSYDFHINTSKNSNKAHASMLNQINYNNFKNNITWKYYKYPANCGGC